MSLSNFSKMPCRGAYRFWTFAVCLLAFAGLAACTDNAGDPF